jgi:hypothetical protein
MKNRGIPFIVTITGVFALISLSSSKKLYYGNEVNVAKLAPETSESSTTDSCFHEKNYAIELNDRVANYLKESFKKGTGKLLSSKNQINRFVNNGKLIKITDNEYYTIGKMRYSYPYLTHNAQIFLNELGERFHLALENTSLQCSRFKITSLLRTTSSVERMMKSNKNSIKNSSHLHGTTFDISYANFVHAENLKCSEISYLAGVLARTLWDLRKEKKCYVTYEVWQKCFHVVVR